MTERCRKSVIYVWNYLEWGGVQTSIISLIREVRKHYQVLVVMPTDSSPELRSLLEQEGAECEFFGPAADLGPARTVRARIGRRIRIIRSEWALLKFLGKKHLSDAIIHIDLAPQKSFLTVAALCSRTHVFFTIHNPFPLNGFVRETSWRLKLRFLSWTSRLHLFAANENAKQSFIPYLSSSPADQITLIRDAINPPQIKNVLEQEFDRHNTLARLSVQSDRFIVLTVGQFIDRKGRWPYLEAVRSLVKKRKDLMFLWVTPEPTSDADLKRVESYEAEASFKMVLSREVGRSREDLLKFFRVADLFVLPSYVEGVPIALLEAMAIGIPCISTNVNGIPEAIRSEETGLLIEPGNPGALAEAVERIIDDRDLADRLATGGRQYVLEKFDDQESARIALEKYDACLDWT